VIANILFDIMHQSLCI